MTSRTPSLIHAGNNPTGNWNYRYRAEVLRVIDGDTVEVLVELGFYASIKIDLRLRDVNTSELKRGPAMSRQLGREQAYYVAWWLKRQQPANVRWPVAIVTRKVDPSAEKWDPTFTRWVGDVLNSKGEALTDQLLRRWPDTYAPDM